MFSLDNFYSILYSNLLRPANFYYQYFSPFGSTDLDDLQDFTEFYWEEDPMLMGPAGGRHRCIAWDQEPLIPELVMQKNNLLRTGTKKFCNILANSERSEFKNQYMQNYNHMNWYYFFHGFAALDWYKNFKYISADDIQYRKIFMSLNRLWQDDRSYRLYLVSKFKEKDLLDKGTVSLHTTDFDKIKKELILPTSKLSKNAKLNIFNNLKDQTLPIIADTLNVPGSASAAGNYSDILFNKSALWHIVSETVFYYDKLHLTEKIFKPIVSKRPFILVGATGNLKYLKEYGFQSFDKWIDESYDNILDDDDRIDAVTEQLSKICSMSNDQQKKMHNEMNEVLEYNFDHFYGKFKYTISKELVDNFKGCCVAWNQNQFRETNLLPIWNCNFEKTIELLSY